MLRDFTLQVHITHQCKNNCEYCYQKGAIRRGPMSFEDYDMILDSYENLLLKLRRMHNVEIDGVIHITGGDPFLLGNDLSEYVIRAKRRGLKAAVLGNPSENKPYMLGIDSVQFTLDKETVSRFDQLDLLNYNIYAFNLNKSKTYLAFNITNDNIDFIINMYKYYLDKKIKDEDSAPDYFSISRCVCNDNVSSENLQKLFKFLFEAEKLNEGFGHKANLPMKVIYRDPLFSLYTFQNGMLTPAIVSHGGCQMGVSMLTVELDKSVYACRRLPIQIGRVEDKFSLYDIFMKGKKLYDICKNSECKKCEIYNHCKGCVAAAYNQYRDVTATDPSCWMHKDTLRRKI